MQIYGTNLFEKLTSQNIHLNQPSYFTFVKIQRNDKET
jgi:hypothetical protein